MISLGMALMNQLQDGDWCKVFCSKDSNEAGQEYYFTNLKTGESSWEEPQSDYWLWDYGTGTYHVSGLQKPTPKETRSLSNCSLTMLSLNHVAVLTPPQLQMKKPPVRARKNRCHTTTRIPPTAGKGTTRASMANTTKMPTTLLITVGLNTRRTSRKTPKQQRRLSSKLWLTRTTTRLLSSTHSLAASKPEISPPIALMKPTEPVVR